jgi:transposase-like protein
MNPMVGTNEYAYIHKWLKDNYGKANNCQHCGKLNAKYHWALRKGFSYERNVENFIQLCISCHSKYDITEESKKKMSASQSRVLKGNKRAYGNQNRRLAEDKIKEVMDLRDLGLGCRRIAAMVGVNKTTVLNIFNKKYY